MAASPRSTRRGENTPEVPLITTNLDHESCIRASERVSWKLDEVFPANLALDFSRRFLPNTITGIKVQALLRGATEQ